MNGPKIYFTIPLLGGIDITQTTVSSFVVMVLLCTAAVVLGGNLQKRPGRRQVLLDALHRRAVPQLDLRLFYRHDRHFPLIYR